MSEFAIQAKKLTKKFGQKSAVSNVSFAIKPGEIYGYGHFKIGNNMTNEEFPELATVLLADQ